MVRQYTQQPNEAGDGATTTAAPAALTRRCRNKLCINRFVPVNVQHYYCSPECRESKSTWSVEEILQEEGGLAPDASPLEMAKRAFGQKNQLVREVSRLTSLRQYLAHEVHTMHNDHPELLTPYVKRAKLKRVNGGGRLRELIVDLSDWQIGKLENGIGVDCMVNERVPRIIDAVLGIAAHFRRSGYVINTCHIIFGGDMIEGCYIYGGQNISGLDRTGNTHHITRQIMLSASLQAQVIEALAGEFHDIYVLSVPGNHGRTNGKNDYSDPNDNFDQMSAYWAQDKTRNLKHVSWDIVENWWGGFGVLDRHYGVAFHGDQWRGPFNRVESLLPQWVLSGVFHGKPDVVLTHHRHDHAVMHVNGVPVIQNGTIDGGSLWYQKAYGKSSLPEQTVIVASEHRITEAIYPISF